MRLEVDVTKRLGTFTCHASLCVDNPKCGVFGPSGSGKSTLMAMIAGLLRPDSGSIILDGVTLFDHEERVDLPPDKRRVGIVFQQAYLFPHMSVRQNLFYGRKRVHRHERTIDPDEIIAMLKLDHLLPRSIARLSGGERQRVALGRTMLANPRLILLDEPLSGLDREMKYQIIPYLQAVLAASGIPHLFISHSLEEMRLMTEQVVVVNDGVNAPPVPTETMARTNLGRSSAGYANLLQLDTPRNSGNLLSCRWGKTDLLLLKGDECGPGRFSLNSRDILLFKKHPEATSARNMLPCRVRKTWTTDWLVGVELDCCGNTLIAEIVPQSIEELDIKAGREVIAVFKASALTRLY